LVADTANGAESNAAKVLVAELSTRNPNVFYELGLAHALHKPVVLVSSNEPNVCESLLFSAALFQEPLRALGAFLLQFAAQRVMPVAHLVDVRAAVAVAVRIEGDIRVPPRLV
jgi:hypothetical protein